MVQPQLPLGVPKHTGLCRCILAGCAAYCVGVGPLQYGPDMHGCGNCPHGQRVWLGTWRPSRSVLLLTSLCLRIHKLTTYLELSVPRHFGVWQIPPLIVWCPQSVQCLSKITPACQKLMLDELKCEADDLRHSGACVGLQTVKRWASIAAKV